VNTLRVVEETPRLRKSNLVEKGNVSAAQQIGYYTLISNSWRVQEKEIQDNDINDINDKKRASSFMHSPDCLSYLGNI
jgi:hypothetical protein